MLKVPNTWAEMKLNNIKRDIAYRSIGQLTAPGSKGMPKPQEVKEILTL